jgi:chaperonin GroES
MAKKNRSVTVARPAPCRVFPIRDNVLVLPDEDPEQIGSIFIPKAAVEMKKFVGTVIAVGTGHITDTGNTIPLAVIPQDRIVYNKYAGSFIEHEGAQYVLIRESDILAVVAPKNEVDE